MFPISGKTVISRLMLWRWNWHHENLGPTYCRCLLILATINTSPHPPSSADLKSLVCIVTDSTWINSPPCRHKEASYDIARSSIFTFCITLLSSVHVCVFHCCWTAACVPGTAELFHTWSLCREHTQHRRNTLTVNSEEHLPAYPFHSGLHLIVRRQTLTWLGQIEKSGLLSQDFS